MRKSKLIQILNTLSKEEFIQFRKVLQSPFFVANKIPLQLYDQIRRYHPDFDSKNLSKEYIFKKIYPHRSYDDNRMRDMMRKLTQLLKDYLIWINIKTDEIDYHKRLIKVYAKQQLFDLYKKERNELLKQLDSQTARGLEYHQHLSELHEDFYYHPQRQKNNRDDPTLEQLDHAIDLSFMLAKLRVGIEMRNQERIFQKKYTINFLEEIFAQQAQHQDNLVVQLYSNLLKIYSTYDGSGFAPFSESFNSNIDQLALRDAQLIYLYALNYINRKVNEGKIGFDLLAFEWYKFGLMNNLLIYENKISAVSFGNIVTYGCRQKEFAWTKKFIEDFGSKIHSEHIEDNIQFNWVIWNFYKGNFDEAFSLLSHYNFHSSFQLKIRLTSLRILFEQFLKDNSYYESLISYTQAFQKYIQRDKLYSKAISTPLKNTIEILKSLATKIMNNEKKPEIKKWFNRKLEINKNIVTKWWLEEKVQQLK